MKINEGNVFEALRILLPEHRAATVKYRQERERPKPPTWDEQHLEELDAMLQEAVVTKNPVHIWITTNGEEHSVQGVIVTTDPDTLTVITTESRRYQLNLREITWIEVE